MIVQAEVYLGPGFVWEDEADEVAAHDEWLAEGARVLSQETLVVTADGIVSWSAASDDDVEE